MSFAGYFLARSLLSAFPAYLRTFFRFDFVWFRLSCDHGWIGSGSVNVRYDLQFNPSEPSRVFTDHFTDHFILFYFV